VKCKESTVSKIVKADRRFAGPSPPSLFAALLLGILASPAAADIPTDVTPPPPASQFREGDHWRSWGFDARGRPTDGFRFLEVRNGAWSRLPNDLDTYSGARDARSFEQLKDPIFYPGAPYDKQIVATADGLLHRYIDGHWVDLPLGSTLADRRGTVYKIDVRATAYDADQLSQVFQHEAMTARPIGENTTSPILLPTADQVAGARETPIDQQAATVDAKRAETPVAGPTPRPVAAPASSGMSVKMAILFLLVGAGGALVLVRLFGRQGTKAS
jgi:hypothetical protein